MKYLHILIWLILLLICGCTRRFDAKYVIVGNSNFVQNIHGQTKTRAITKDEFIKLLNILDGSEEFEYEKGVMYRMTTEQYLVGDLENENGRIRICNFNSGFVYKGVRYVNIGNIDVIIPENRMR